MKNIFERKLGLIFSDKETILELNGCRIEAFPSNHIGFIQGTKIPSSYCWTKQTSFVNQNRMTLDLSVKGTSVIGPLYCNGINSQCPGRVIFENIERDYEHIDNVYAGTRQSILHSL